MKVTYIYSACVKIETPDISILCDPWFTDGIYDGSWYLYPPVKDPIRLIGEVTNIWISHIHPDHYDPVFLRKYLEKYPRTGILISDFNNNFLKKKMLVDGFDPFVIEGSFKIGETTLYSIPSESGSINDIDAALVVTHDGHSVVNMNDCQYEVNLVEKINKICPNPDIALLGYASAGPYPQTYDMSEATMRDMAEKKKRQFAIRHLELRQALNPKSVIPFAGQYLLGGKLAHLNDFRGVPDATEVPDAVVLDEGAWITEELKPSVVRKGPYCHTDMRKYLKKIVGNPMDYQYFPEIDYPIKRLMPKAYLNAKKKCENDGDYYFCIKYRNEWLVCNASMWCSTDDTDIHYQVFPSVDHLSPRSEITIDERYLFGLLTGVYHWNNAEVGSQFFTKRVPDVYNKEAQAFLNFLTV